MTDSWTTPEAPAHRTDDRSGSTGITTAGNGLSTDSATYDSAAYDSGTYDSATYDSATYDDGSAGDGKAQEAKTQAANVAGGAKDAGQQVAGEAKAQAAEVGREAKTQAKDLLHQTRGELTTQAGEQQTRVASGLRAIGSELGQMASSGDEPGPAADVAHQVSQRIDAAAQWLEDREPGQVLQDVQTFARQRPGTFLAIAAGAGLLVGRLARGVKDASSDDTTSANDTVDVRTAGLPVASPQAYGSPAIATDPVEPGFASAADLTAPATAPATPGYYGPADGTSGSRA